MLSIQFVFQCIQTLIFTISLGNKCQTLLMMVNDTVANDEAFPWLLSAAFRQPILPVMAR